MLDCWCLWLTLPAYIDCLMLAHSSNYLIVINWLLTIMLLIFAGIYTNRYRTRLMSLTNYWCKLHIQGRCSFIIGELVVYPCTCNQFLPLVRMIYVMLQSHHRAVRVVGLKVRVSHTSSVWLHNNYMNLYLSTWVPIISCLLKCDNLLYSFHYNKSDKDNKYSCKPHIHYKYLSTRINNTIIMYKHPLNCPNLTDESFIPLCL